MLDHMYRLEQARKNEIENNGDAVSIWPHRGVLKTIKDGNTFYFSQSATIKPGYILTHVDCFGAFLVTTITDQAGRIAADTMHLKS